MAVTFASLFMLILPLRSVDLEKHPNKWAALFEKTWPAYKRWFLKEGLFARAGYLSSISAFEQHLPELVDVYKTLCEQVGGGDLTSRYLSMYNPPPYMSGCSQIAWLRDKPELIRNYDYSPRYFEGLLMKTNWLKPIVGMSDCNWGLLDGVNADGLTASLTFGGRRITGDGFGIPIVLRYCLETCSNTHEAVKVLLKVPTHMSYNITLLDSDLNFATVYMVPNGQNHVTGYQVGTNHQGEITWSDYAIMTRTVERMTLLESCIHNPHERTNSLRQKFLTSPLYNNQFSKAFGTLYSAAYSPIEKSVDLFWPNKTVTFKLNDFAEEHVQIKLNTKVNRLLTI